MAHSLARALLRRRPAAGIVLRQSLCGPHVALHPGSALHPGCALHSNALAQGGGQLAGSALLGAGLHRSDVWGRSSALVQQATPLGDAGTTRALPLAAVLLDAAGTLLSPSEHVGDVYLRYAAKYGVTSTRGEVLQRFRRAYNAPYTESRIRYVGDARPFWSTIVAQSTGCSDARLCEEIYEYYEQPAAWKLTDGVVPALLALRAAGIKLAVVSNFDTRLRPILDSLGVLHMFDAVIVSAEVGAEKPNPMIFEAALESLDVPAEAVVHVGDDRRNDLWGARDAGITGWLWGSDVKTFHQLARWAIQGGITDDDDDEVDDVQHLQA